MVVVRGRGDMYKVDCGQKTPNEVKKGGEEDKQAGIKPKSKHKMGIKP